MNGVSKKFIFILENITPTERIPYEKAYIECPIINISIVGSFKISTIIAINLTTTDTNSSIAKKFNFFS